MSLLGKRIVVLGGTAGIGFAVARAATEAGAEPVVASSTKERAAAAVARLGDDAAGYVVDVLDEEGMRGFFAELGPFDHLVYTAGDRPRLAPVRTLAPGDARDALEVRLWGCYTAVHEALAGLRPGGSIVLSSGGAAVRPSPGWALAAAATAAVEGLTRALAVELAPIRVNVVRPGVVRTDLWNVVPPRQREQLLAEHAARLPVRHVPQAEAVAKAYLFALEAQYCTGSVIEIDGGASLV